MTTPTATSTTMEELRLAGVESRISGLEATMTRFIEEQREHRREINARFDKMEEEQREHRREINARFDKWEEEQREYRREVSARFDKMEEEQREHRREVNTRFDRIESRVDAVVSNVSRSNLAVLAIVGALAVSVIVAAILS